MKEQLDRIEGRLQTIDDRTRMIESQVARLEGRLEGEKTGEGHSAAWIKYLVTAAIGALSGLIGSTGSHLSGGH